MHIAINPAKPGAESIAVSFYDTELGRHVFQALREAKAPDLPAAAFLPPVRMIPHLVRVICKYWV